MNWLKNILRNWQVAQKFNTEMKVICGPLYKKPLIKVSLTKEQVQISKLCAELGLRNTKQLFKALRRNF